MVVHPMDGEFSRIVKLIREIEIALLTTVDRDGHFHARPVQTLAIERDRSLWFFTDIRSEKAFELTCDVRLDLGYADPKAEDISPLLAPAECCAMPIKRGSSGLSSNVPTIRTVRRMSTWCLLRVQVERAEYWLPGGRTAHLLAALKARATGIPTAIVGRNCRIN